MGPSKRHGMMSHDDDDVLRLEVNSKKPTWKRQDSKPMAHALQKCANVLRTIGECKCPKTFSL